MSFREMIRGIVRDEMFQISQPTASESPTAQVLSDRQASLARLAARRAEAVAIDAREFEITSDIERIQLLETELDEIRRAFVLIGHSCGVKN